MKRILTLLAAIVCLCSCEKEQKHHWLSREWVGEYEAQVQNNDLLDGGWYHILVPDKGKSNTVIITVDPHDDTKPRQATIEMQAGNAFTTFTISQP